MIYVFKCKATGDLTMTGPSGDQLLRIVGKEPAAKGIIEPAAMPAAIAAIEAAIAQEQSQPRQSAKGPAAEGLAESDDEPVTLRQRAWPLLEMIRRAHADDEAIVWGV